MNMNQRQVVDVKIKKLHPAAVIPQYARAMDAGFDLVAVEDMIIGPGETSVTIPLGLAFALPEGYELQVRPRSGVGKNSKLRISNAPGTVDAGYRGEVAMMFDNISPVPFPNEKWEPTRAIDGKIIFGTKAPRGTFMVRRGDRVAQGVIAAVPVARFEEVDELDETERGEGGFGSSGIK
jgi:dUTP pyrophosphatase